MQYLYIVLKYFVKLLMKTLVLVQIEQMLPFYYIFHSII